MTELKSRLVVNAPAIGATLVGLSCITISVVWLTLFVLGQPGGAKATQKDHIEARLSSISKRLETYDRRRNAQYGELRALILSLRHDTGDKGAEQ